MNIAIIGCGISGLTAAYYLNPRHNLTLFESAARIGGHTATVDVDWAGHRYAIDTGFIVYNPPAYPNLTALFARLKVPAAPSNMSFSVSMGEGAYESRQCAGNTWGPRGQHGQAGGGRHQALGCCS